MPDNFNDLIKESKTPPRKPVSIELPPRPNNPVSMTAAAISPPRATNRTTKIDSDLAREVELLARKKMQAEEDAKAGVRRLSESERAAAEKRRQTQLMAILGFAIVAAFALIFLATFEKSKADHMAQRNVPGVAGAGAGTQTTSGFGTQGGSIGPNGRPTAVGYYPAVSPYAQGAIRQAFPRTYTPQPAQQTIVPHPEATSAPAPVQAQQTPTQTYPVQAPVYAPPVVVQQPYPYSPPVQATQPPVAQQPAQWQQPATAPPPQPVQAPQSVQQAPQPVQDTQQDSNVDDNPPVVPVQTGP